MFAPARLFASVPCPDRASCDRNPCIFSHAPTPVPSAAPVPSAPIQMRPSFLSVGTPFPTSEDASSSGTKRQANLSSTGLSPPRKTMKVPGKTVPRTESKMPKGKTTPGASPLVQGGPPLLRVSAGASKIPIADRQQMLDRLYKQFVELYQPILFSKPTLASDHALAQEVEIYNRTTAKTYRNATTNALIAIRKRISPTSPTHLSVGTESEIQARNAAAKEYPALKLTTEDLEPALLTREQLLEWGFIVEVPDEWGVGGNKVNEIDNSMKCERCAGDFKVQPDPDQNECQYHWGRIWTKKVEGKRKKYYTCCQQEHPYEGCTRGCHVFYDTEPQVLHSRHAFSSTSKSEESPSQLSVVAIDCEMIYTTAGMSVARVSVIDGTGKVVFDELVKPTSGVDTLDYNSRFSGVHSLDTATMDLVDIKKALSSIIGSDTIVIGHAVDNDLKTLRMIHHKVVDTIQLFRHHDGPSRRRALRDLSSEILGRTIQAGAASSGESSMGSVGHSSVEDARATLDLVRWWVCERRKKAAAM